MEIVNSDPHFKELYHSEVSTIDTTKVALNYLAIHKLPLGPWAEFTKLKLDFLVFSKVF